MLVQAGPREQRSSRALVWLVAPVHHDRVDLPISRFEQAADTGGLATDAANSKSHFELAASSVAFMPEQSL